MKRLLYVPWFVVVLCFVLTPAAVADSVSVEYTVSNLGSGLWQYNYTLQGSFLANWGVAVYFPTPSYGGPITDLGTGGSDWTTFAFQPDLSIPAPGEFDMVALIDNPSLTPIFGATFFWNQPGTPRGQTFDLFNFSNGGAALIGSGTTSAATVPEPSSLLLFVVGLSSCLAARLARRS